MNEGMDVLGRVFRVFMQFGDSGEASRESKARIVFDLFWSALAT